jgi:hypothetical protein
MLDVQYKVVPSGTSVVLTVTVTLPPSLTLELFATGLAVGVAGVITSPMNVGGIILKLTAPDVLSIAFCVL